MTAARLILPVAIVAAIVTAILVAWRAPDSAAISGYTQTQTGPCGPADGDLLVKVKQDGMWEIPVGDDLAARAHDPKVREVGRKMSEEHRELNALTDRAAAEVGMPLPTHATLEQEAWVRQVAASPDPDVLAVNLLRAAHGKILPVLAGVKAGTRNSTIRQFATVGLIYAGRHISYLESTGYVDYTALPESPAPVASISPVKASYYYAADRPALAFAVLVIAVLGFTLVAQFLTRPDRRRPIPDHPRHTRRRT